MNETNNEEFPDIQLDFAAHGPNWLVGRSGRTRKTKNKDLQKTDDKKLAELAKIKEELSTEMEEKMNQKLKAILGKIAKVNPTLQMNVEELCVENSLKDVDEVDGDGVDS